MSDGTSAEAPPAPPGSANGTSEGEGPGGTGVPAIPPAPLSAEEAEALRAQRQEARQADRSSRQRLKALETELEASKRSAMSEHERALAEAVEAARAEVEASWAGRYLTLRVERLAASLMADPSDATRLLDMEALKPDTPDEEITKLLDKLLEAKPYLAVSRNGNGSIATPPLDRGPRGGTPPVSVDMNELLRARR